MMAPLKRPAEDETPPGNKLIKGEGVEEFSNAVKKKLSASTRTGQACDRCRVRKIRCDGRPGGCTPCITNNTDCKTTDRITGRATSRGHTEAIEQDNIMLKQHVLVLEQQIRDLGGQPKPRTGYTAPPPPQSEGRWSHRRSIDNGHSWHSPGPSVGRERPASYETSSGQTPQSQTENLSTTRTLPAIRTGAMGDNYLGVSSANSFLSPIKGTSLSLFGMEIDLSEFIPGEQDEPDSPTSYQSFLDSVMGRANRIKPNLPERQEYEMLATWYLRSLNPFLPILHKPTVMQLVDRLYSDPSFQPTAAQVVMFHMIVACLKYQFGRRNFDQGALDQSSKHYHYSLTLVHELISSHTVEDVQALTLICSHVRTFPKPGPAWMLTNWTMGLAIETGLHRSAKAWADTVPKKDIQEIEMRKRVFYALLTMHVSISGRLGRPMPFRPEDIDVELPEALNDDLPSEGLTNEFRKCSFRVGIEVQKLAILVIKMYSTIYAVQPSAATYEATVRQLEEELEKWKSELPPELTDPDSTSEEGRVSALYLPMFGHEFQIQLHHPALCQTTKPDFMTRNLDIILASATEMRRGLVELSKFKSLDTTWMHSTVYLAACFTTLFAYSERVDQLTQTDLNNLKLEMESWLELMGEIGTLLGSGERLQEAIGRIVEGTIRFISRHLVTKTASAAVGVALQASSSVAPDLNIGKVNENFPMPTHSNMLQTSENLPLPRTDPGNGTGSYLQQLAIAAAPPSDAAYTSTAQYPYAGQPTTGLPPTYPISATPFDASNRRLSVEGSAAGLDQGRLSGSYPHANGSPHQPSGSSAWKHWTENMLITAGPQEFANPANALLALGSGDMPHNPNTAVPAPVPDLSSLAASQLVPDPSMALQGHQQPIWPMVVYGIGEPNGM